MGLMLDEYEYDLLLDEYVCMYVGLMGGGERGWGMNR